MAVRGARARKIAPSEGISGSFDDVERKDFYEGEQPKPGLYPGKLVSVEQHTTSDDSIHWVFDITSGQFKGWRGHLYSNMSSAKFKTEQCLVGLGVIEEGGTINHTFDQIMKKAKPCRLRTVFEEYNDEQRAKISRVMVASADAEPDEDDDEPDEDFDDDPKPSRARGRKKPEPEPEDDEDEAEDEPAEDDERAERLLELEELSLADLKKEAKAAGFALKDYRGKDSVEIATMILDKEYPGAEDDEEGDDEGEELDLEALEEELSELSLADLKKKAKEYGLALKDYKGKDEEGVIELILDKLEADGEPPF